MKWFDDFIDDLDSLSLGMVAGAIYVLVNAALFVLHELFAHGHYMIFLIIFAIIIGVIMGNYARGK